MTENTENKVVREQTFKIKITHFEDGTYIMDRVNDGFNVLELFGILDFTRGELVDTVKGKIKPDQVKRTVITE